MSIEERPISLKIKMSKESYNYLDAISIKNSISHHKAFEIIVRDAKELLVERKNRILYS